jgi:hypothetical protein
MSNQAAPQSGHHVNLVVAMNPGTGLQTAEPQTKRKTPARGRGIL